MLGKTRILVYTKKSFKLFNALSRSLSPMVTRSSWCIRYASPRPGILAQKMKLSIDFDSAPQRGCQIVCKGLTRRIGGQDLLPVRPSDRPSDRLTAPPTVRPTVRLSDRPVCSSPSISARAPRYESIAKLTANGSPEQNYCKNGVPRCDIRRPILACEIIAPTVDAM